MTCCEGQLGGVDLDRVVRLGERGGLAAGVGRVPLDQRLPGGGDVGALQLAAAAGGTGLGGSGEEDLQVGVGQHRGADVAALDDDAGCSAAAAMDRCSSMIRARTSGTALTALTLEVTSWVRIGPATSTPSTVIVRVGGSVPETISGLPAAAAIAAGSSTSMPLLHHPPGDRPVLRAGVQVAQPELRGDGLGGAGLARAGGAVDGDDHRAVHSGGAFLVSTRWAPAPFP